MEKQAAQESPKWKATVLSSRTNASADQIWPFLQDFFGLYKWFPNLSTSYGIHGKNGDVGSIRYCEGFSIPSQKIDKNNGHDDYVSWSKERLIEIDSDEKKLSYEIVDSNIGFNSYVARMKIIPESGCNGDDHQEGCVIKWSIRVDPVAGLEFEDFVKKYELGLQGMLQKIESALKNIEN